MQHGPAKVCVSAHPPLGPASLARHALGKRGATLSFWTIVAATAEDRVHTATDV